jgi:predicted dienelactone hydrolase
MTDIRQPGNLGFQKETFTLTDSSRNRSFYVILYKPQQWREGKTPVVILSHGLASNPEDFEGVAQYLASYGYVVAIPQHPGSDTKQAKALLEGYSREVFELNEFINRPKDISYVIDELERRNQSEFEGRLDLENVGVAGHSFGGYTALAVAGAVIDFDYLQKICDRLYGGLNTSLLLQCKALKLPRQTYNFRDHRVKAVIGANPVNSGIFGQKGLSEIQIPILLLSGNYDPATPAVFEQLRSFIWLTAPDKYLVLAEGQAHVDFSELDAGITKVIDSVPNLTLPEPSLLKSYLHPTLLSFFEVYIANNPQYRPYLGSSYDAYLSENENFKVYRISAASEPALRKAIEEFRAREGALSP